MATIKIFIHGEKLKIQIEESNGKIAEAIADSETSNLIANALKILPRVSFSGGLAKNLCWSFDCLEELKATGLDG